MRFNNLEFNPNLHKNRIEFTHLVTNKNFLFSLFLSAILGAFSAFCFSGFITKHVMRKNNQLKEKTLSDITKVEYARSLIEDCFNRNTINITDDDIEFSYTNEKFEQLANYLKNSFSTPNATVIGQSVRDGSILFRANRSKDDFGATMINLFYYLHDQEASKSRTLFIDSFENRSEYGYYHDWKKEWLYITQCRYFTYDEIIKFVSSERRE